MPENEISPHSNEMHPGPWETAVINFYGLLDRIMQAKDYEVAAFLFERELKPHWPTLEACRESETELASWRTGDGQYMPHFPLDNFAQRVVAAQLGPDHRIIFSFNGIGVLRDQWENREVVEYGRFFVCCKPKRPFSVIEVGGLGSCKWERKIGTDEDFPPAVENFWKKRENRTAWQLLPKPESGRILSPKQGDGQTMARLLNQITQDLEHYKRFG